MESSGCKFNEERSDVDKRSVWGWLAAATVAGVLVAQGYRRAGLAIGLGLALWKSGGSKEGCAPGNLVSSEPTGVADEPADESQKEEEGGEAHAGWLLNLEPVPLVVREDRLPASGQGQGGDLLGQGPGQAVEELDWVAPVVTETHWLNEGAEIPDAVELPELGDAPGSLAEGSSGV